MAWGCDKKGHTERDMPLLDSSWTELYVKQSLQAFVAVRKQNSDGYFCVERVSEDPQMSKCDFCERIARLNVFSPSPSHSERFGAISFCPDPCKGVWFCMPSSARTARETDC